MIMGVGHGLIRISRQWPIDDRQMRWSWEPLIFGLKVRLLGKYYQIFSTTLRSKGQSPTSLNRSLTDRPSIDPLTVRSAKTTEMVYWRIFTVFSGGGKCHRWPTLDPRLLVGSGDSNCKSYILCFIIMSSPIPMFLISDYMDQLENLRWKPQMAEEIKWSFCAINPLRLLINRQLL